MPIQYLYILVHDLPKCIAAWTYSMTFQSSKITVRIKYNIIYNTVNKWISKNEWFPDLNKIMNHYIFLLQSDKKRFLIVCFKQTLTALYSNILQHTPTYSNNLQQSPTINSCEFGTGAATRSFCRPRRTSWKRPCCPVPRSACNWKTSRQRYFCSWIWNKTLERLAWRILKMKNFFFGLQIFAEHKLAKKWGPVLQVLQYVPSDLRKAALDAVKSSPQARDFERIEMLERFRATRYYIGCILMSCHVLILVQWASMV